jgi:hypothetical protein
MNADTPRLVGNCAGVHHLNSVHGVYLRPELKQLGTDLLPLAVLNSVTLLGAETVGRSYGGGLLKLEPGEADRLPVPSPELVAQVRAGLVAIRGQVAAELAAGRLLAAVQRVDSVLLAGGFGLAGSEIAILAQARELLAGRRAARAGRPAQPSQPLMSRAEP